MHGSVVGEASSAAGGELSADIVSLPRLVTSRSYEKLGVDDFVPGFRSDFYPDLQP